LGDELWATDPTTLRDTVLDRDAIVRRLQVCSALERVWLLSLLGRSDEAAEHGEVLLARAVNKFHPLLVLARAYQGQYRWQETALLQEEALRLAGTPEREAYARHQIGRRLFEEARYRDAAAEFEWARDLFRSSGRGRHLIEASEQAMLRARELAVEQFPGDIVPARDNSGPCASLTP
jgi:tetratricopeptide (TPR) repeat protein